MHVMPHVTHAIPSMTAMAWKEHAVDLVVRLQKANALQITITSQPLSRRWPIIGRVGCAATRDCRFVEPGTVPEAPGFATDDLIEPNVPKPPVGT
jgi:hypothetical protein